MLVSSLINEVVLAAGV